MDKFIKKTIIPARPRQHVDKPTYKQSTITSLKKVNVIEDIIGMKEKLSKALMRNEWDRVIDMLKILRSQYLANETLEQTKIGVVVGKLRKAAKIREYAEMNHNHNINGHSTNDTTTTAHRNNITDNDITDSTHSHTPSS